MTTGLPLAGPTTSPPLALRNRSTTPPRHWPRLPSITGAGGECNPRADRVQLTAGTTTTVTGRAVVSLVTGVSRNRRRYDLHGCCDEGRRPTTSGAFCNGPPWWR